MMSLLVYTGLIGIATYTDWRWRIVPNALSWIAIGFGLAMIGTHTWGWSHLYWAAGTWIAYELMNLIFPQGSGYGDFKVATWTTGFWPGIGLLLLIGGHLWTVLYGTYTWWKNHRVTAWSQATGPWAVGVGIAWLALLASHL